MGEARNGIEVGFALSSEDVAWLEKHRALLSFDDGKPLSIEIRRDDGLRVQCSDFDLTKLLKKAHQLTDGDWRKHLTPRDSQ